MIVTIQSAGRPENVEKMQKELHPLKPYWFVPESCADDYYKAGIGSNYLYIVKGDYPNKPMKTKQLNAALDFAFSINRTCVTMDDDFENVKRVYEENGVKKQTSSNIDLYTLLHQMTIRLRDSKYYLAGLDMTTNLLFKGSDRQEHGMVSGQILFHKPNKIRFDENCQFLEDLDYVIAHHIEHGGLLRYNYYVINFHIYGRSKKSDQKYEGGYENFRNLKDQEEILNYIRTKYDTDLIKFPDKTEVGKSLHGKIKWKQLKNLKNNLERFM